VWVNRPHLRNKKVRPAEHGQRPCSYTTTIQVNLPFKKHQYTLMVLISRGFKIPRGLMCSGLQLELEFKYETVFQTFKVELLLCLVRPQRPSFVNRLWRI
jgi:hypothetical protein